MLRVIIIVGLYLAIMALLDIRSRKIPSVLSTTVILFLAIFSVWSGRGLEFGMLAFIFAWLLYDFDYFHGVADIKAMVIIGLMLTSLNSFYTFIMVTVIVGLAYQIIVSKIIKPQNRQEIPFVPVFFLVYVVMMIVMYVL